LIGITWNGLKANRILTFICLKKFTFISKQCKLSTIFANKFLFQLTTWLNGLHFFKKINFSLADVYPIREHEICWMNEFGDRFTVFITNCFLFYICFAQNMNVPTLCEMRYFCCIANKLKIKISLIVIIYKNHAHNFSLA